MPETPRNRAVWLAPLLALAALASYFTLIISRPAFADLRDFPWLNLVLLAVAVVLSARAVPRAWLRGGLLRRSGAIAGLGFSALCAVMLSYYLFVSTYRVPDAASVVPTGESIPEITLADQRDRPVDLAQLSQGDSVLVFYRGHW